MIDLPFLRHQKSQKMLWDKELWPWNSETDKKNWQKARGTFPTGHPEGAQIQFYFLQYLRMALAPWAEGGRCLWNNGPSGSLSINGRWNLPNEHPVSQSIAVKGWQCGRPNRGNEELISCCQVKSSLPCPFLSLLSYISQNTFNYPSLPTCQQALGKMQMKQCPSLVASRKYH